MKAHELARKLLGGPDLPVATYANNHSYYSQSDAKTHGELSVVVSSHYDGDYVLVGNVAKGKTLESKALDACFRSLGPRFNDLYFCLYDWDGKELTYDGYAPVKLDRNYETASMKEVKAPAFDGDTSIWANTHRIDFGECKSGNAEAHYIGIRTDNGDMLYQAKIEYPVMIDHRIGTVSILPGDFEIVDVSLW